MPHHFSQGKTLLASNYLLQFIIKNKKIKPNTHKVDNGILNILSLLKVKAKFIPITLLLYMYTHFPASVIRGGGSSLL